MPIDFPCNSCNQLLRVPDGSQGKSCQCPTCGAASVIPDTTSARPAQQFSAVTEDAATHDGNSQVTVTCPKCKYTLLCKQELIGTKGQCKQCKHIFVIGDILPSIVEEAALVFSCPKCHQLFDGKAEMAGRKGRCHTCGEVFMIELREAASEPSPTIKKSSKWGGSPAAAKTPTPQSSSAASQRGHSSTAPKPVAKDKRNIQLTCPSCKGGLEVAPSTAGLKTSCPHCHQLLQIPELGGSSSVHVGQSIFDQPTDDVFSGITIEESPSPASYTTAPSLLDFDAAFSNSTLASGQPYMGPQANASGYTTPAYSTNNYQLGSYQSPYQSPSSSMLSSAVSARSGQQWLRSLAIWHKQLILSLMLQLTVIAIFLLLTVLVPLMINGKEPSRNLAIGLGIFSMLSLIMAAVLSIWFLVSYIVLCLKLYDGGKAAMFIVGYFLGGCIPFLPLILLILLIVNTNAKLREHGVSVGFLGADFTTI